MSALLLAVLVVGGATPPAPGWSPAVERQLHAARRMALARLEVEACQGIFEPLGASGAATVESLRFRPPAGPLERRLCQAAAMLAYAGDPAVVVCPDRFAALPPSEQAGAVIHEALHVAGMGEAPAVAGAPTSGEITEAVREACRLETAANLPREP